jgi:hypothetical protein
MPKRIFSLLHRKRLSEAATGRKMIYKHPEERRIKIGLNGFHYGMLGKKHSEETKRKLSISGVGRKHTAKSKEKMSLSNIGKKMIYKHPEERNRKISESEKEEKHYNWQGGKTSKNRRIRRGIEFRLWREAVFARDNWTCQKTGIKGGELHPHHIYNFADFPELRFAIENGITLSDKIHQEFHQKYGKRYNFKYQLDEFLKEQVLTINS